MHLSKKLATVATAAALLCTLTLAAGTALATVSGDSGFEGADANLAVNGASTMDWNGFKPVSWVGTAPYQTAQKTASAGTNGWKFTGIGDAQAVNTDTVFGGGVKQDDSCASVTPGPKAPNKDDLKSIYVAQKMVNGNTYLGLAWTRIPQNSTSSSAHVAFEFNQSATKCSATSPLVQRSTANGGDMLIVYDFEGGSSPAILKLLRWKTSGTCEETGKAATAVGCWVLQNANLNSGGLGEANVNTTPALDELSADGNYTYQSQEFGEAIVNLSAAGVFPTGTATSCVTFGGVYGVSRSSGNSGTAQMKDLVGPADASVTNCGSIVIKKVDQAGAALAGASFTITPGKTTGSTTATSSSMDAVAGFTGVFCIDNLLLNTSYTIHESVVPTGYSGSADKTFTPTTTSTCSGRVAAAAPNAPAVDDNLIFTNTRQFASLSALKEVSLTGTGGWGSTATASTGSTVYYRLTFGNSGNVSGTISPTDNMAQVLNHASFNNDCKVAINGGSASSTVCSVNASKVLSFASSPFTVTAGGSVVITYSVTLDAVFPSGTTELINVITAANTNCATPANVAACTTDTTVGAAANVSALKQVSLTGTGGWGNTATASPGANVYYRLTFTNSGNASSTVSPTDDMSQVLNHASFNADCKVATNGGAAVSATCSVDATTKILSFAGSPFTVSAGGGTIVITYSVKLDSVFPTGTTDLINVITASGTNCASPSGVAACTTDTSVGAAANVAALKQVSLAASGPWSSSVSAATGATVYYKVTFTNSGNANASITPTDDLSDVLEHAAFNDDCAINGGAVSAANCSLNGSDVMSLAGSPFTVTANGGVLTITYSVKLDDVFPAGETHLTNLIVASGTNCASGSVDAACSTDTKVTAAADVSAIKEVSTSANGPWAATASADPGDTLYYRVTITNIGDADATTSPTDDLSDVLTHASFNDDCMVAIDGGTAAADACTVDANDTLSFAGSAFTVHAKTGSVVITYSVDVDSSGFTFAVHLVNLVVVPGSNCVEGSGDPDCTTDTTVTPAPDVTITKVATDNFPPTFLVTVNAIGTGTSTNVVTTDTLPDGWMWKVESSDFAVATACDDDANALTTFDPTSVQGGDTLVCSLGDMDEGSSLAFTLTAVEGPSVYNEAHVHSGNQSTDALKIAFDTIQDILKDLP